MTGYFSRALTGKVVLRLAGLGAAALLLFGALGAWVLYPQIEAQELERLALQAAERARVAEQVPSRVTEMHQTVRDEFARRWPSSACPSRPTSATTPSSRRPGAPTSPPTTTS